MKGTWKNGKINGEGQYIENNKIKKVLFENGKIMKWLADTSSEKEILTN